MNTGRSLIVAGIKSRSNVRIQLRNKCNYDMICSNRYDIPHTGLHHLTYLPILEMFAFRSTLIR